MVQRHEQEAAQQQRYAYTEQVEPVMDAIEVHFWSVPWKVKEWYLAYGCGVCGLGRGVCMCVWCVWVGGGVVCEGVCVLF